MSTDLIRYDLLTQEALRGVVRRVLEDVGRTGIPGEHHFYISFRTDFPGVRVSSRLREKYPEEMTIILQHQFWDLVVGEHMFEVGLSFGGVPERLVVPFDAVTGFFDPSVKFGLKFESRAGESLEDVSSEDGNEEPSEQPDADVARITPTRPVREENAASSESGEEAAAGAEGSGSSAEVVSLDKFRKK
jgi:hypothetical protein